MQIESQAATNWGMSGLNSNENLHKVNLEQEYIYYKK